MRELKIITETDGTLVVFSNHYKWVCVARQPHTRRDGVHTEFLTWEAPCIECDQFYQLTTGRNFENSHGFELRRCPRHRKGQQADARQREQDARKVRKAAMT